MLEALGWAERYIDGQIEALEGLGHEGSPGTAFVAEHDERVVGFISVAFYRWNRLGQIHGLAVDPAFHRRKIGCSLMLAAEEDVRGRGGRGIYADTPVTNHTARCFYVALGYFQDYVMSQYYDVDLDGVTYVKFFRSVQGGDVTTRIVQRGRPT
ncbi:MAG: GNAT family N-acetyltransferase [Chloroflexi bacterium]|nr:GNAT family N-acetyltransferase [Chloroflexota bacterium]